MALILCLETATTNCSVALSENGTVKSLREDNPEGVAKGFSHAEKLHGYIESVLEEARISPRELDAIAVSKGPGSYTGLRIGVSAAKGLCFSLDVPLISISTLDSLANKAKAAKVDFIIPMLDARRMEVYSAVYNSEQHQVREVKAEILTNDSFDAYLSKGKVAFLGSGVDKFERICEHSNAVFISNALPSAAEMVVLAEAKTKIGDYENVAYFEPYYLKDFIAG